MRKFFAAAAVTSVLLGSAGLAQATSSVASSLESEIRAVQTDSHLTEFLSQESVASQQPVSLVRTAAGPEFRFRTVAPHDLAPELRTTATRWNRLVGDERFSAVTARTSAAIGKAVLAASRNGEMNDASASPDVCVGYAQLIAYALPYFLDVALDKVTSCTSNLSPGALASCELGAANYAISNRITVLQYLVGFCLDVARTAAATTSAEAASPAP